MPYSDFTLLSVEHAFELRRTEAPRLFLDVPPCVPASKLEETLAEGIPLAIAMNTEKARSELLIMPVLLEVRRHFPGQASLFSGVLFDVDPARGLTVRGLSAQPACLAARAHRTGGRRRRGEKRQSLERPGAVPGDHGGRPVLQYAGADGRHEPARRGDDRHPLAVSPARRR